MSLYRQPGRYGTRTIAIAVAAAVVLGLVLGFALGRGTADKPTLADDVAALSAGLGTARDGVELVATEYPQAVRGGRVVAKTEYGAAQSDVQRAQDAVAKHAADLRAVGRLSDVQQPLARLKAAIDQRADPAQVRQLAAAAQAALRSATSF
jgi:hypothetical protein